MGPREARWHHLVQPKTDTERRRAAEEFLRVTGFALSPLEALELLEPWFERGWPLKAVIYGLDHTYDGERQRYHRKESDADSFHRRMTAWVDGFGKLRPPPKDAVDPEELEARERRRWHEEVGHAQPATARSEPARRHVRAVAENAYTRARGDRVERVRQADQRVRRAMDTLGRGPRLVEPEEVFAAEHNTQGAMFNEITHRAAMRTSGLDDESAQALAEPRTAPARQVLSNKYRRYRQAQAYSRLDELVDPQMAEPPQ